MKFLLWRLLDAWTPLGFIIATLLNMHEQLEFERRANEIARDVIKSIRNEMCIDEGDEG